MVDSWPESFRTLVDVQDQMSSGGAASTLSFDCLFDGTEAIRPVMAASLFFAVLPAASVAAIGAVGALRLAAARLRGRTAHGVLSQTLTAVCVVLFMLMMSVAKVLQPPPPPPRAPPPSLPPSRPLRLVPFRGYWLWDCGECPELGWQLGPRPPPADHPTPAAAERVQRLRVPPHRGGPLGDGRRRDAELP